jgi:hypothetical protein
VAVIRTASNGASVPRARQVYLFEQSSASGAYPGTSKFYVDPRAPDAPAAGPELDPEALCCDPTDPDSWASDPETWPDRFDDDVWDDPKAHPAPTGIPIYGRVQ